MNVYTIQNPSKNRGSFSKSLELAAFFCEINKLYSLDEIVKTAVNHCGEISGSSRCFFAGINFHDWVIQAEYTNKKTRSFKDKPFLKIEGFSLNSPLGRKFLKNKFLKINDLEREKKSLPKKLYENYLKLNIRSFLYLPIKLKNKTCGVLGFHQVNEFKEWSDEELELLITTSKQISLTINNAQLISDLKVNNEKLLNLDKLKSQLMNTISHELRTPISNILGFSELLLNRDFPKNSLKEYVGEIYNSSQRLSRLVDNFLDLSRLEATGQLYLNAFEETEIDWLAEKAWNQLGGQNKDHKIEWIIGKKLPIIFVDSESIIRVFSNLFSNAIKYSPLTNNLTPEEKELRAKISCSIQANKNEILVTVEDHGVGIPDNLAVSIFDRFTRVENSNTKDINGTGLGLWICKEIVQAHSGHIWYKSTYGKGTKFSFVLPLHKGTNKVETNVQIWLN